MWFFPLGQAVSVGCAGSKTLGSTEDLFPAGMETPAGLSSMIDTRQALVVHKKRGGTLDVDKVEESTANWGANPVSGG